MSGHEKCQLSSIHEDIDFTYERDVSSIGSKITVVDFHLGANLFDTMQYYKNATLSLWFILHKQFRALY